MEESEHLGNHLHVQMENGVVKVLAQLLILVEICKLHKIEMMELCEDKQLTGHLQQLFLVLKTQMEVSLVQQACIVKKVISILVQKVNIDRLKD